jgi:hypothetical protein
MQYRLRKLLIVLAVVILMLAWRNWLVTRDALWPPMPISQAGASSSSDEPIVEPPPDPTRPPVEMEREAPQGIRDYLKWNRIETSTIPKVGMKLEELVTILGEPTSRLSVQGDSVIKDPNGPFVNWRGNKGGAQAAPSIAVQIEDGVVIWIVAPWN